MNQDTKDTHPDGAQPAGDKTDRTDEIQSVRDEINRIDTEIIKLLAARRHQSGRAVQAKDVGHGPIRDRKREEAMLIERIRAGRACGLDSHFVTQVFHDIIDDSVRMQQDYLQRRANAGGEQELVRVAFQGSEGAYSHLAAQEHFSRDGANVRFVGCATYREAMAAVEKGQAEYVVLPIENTASGGINEVYDLLLHTQLMIVGEAKRKQQLSLLGLPGTSLAQIKRIYCHPQAAMQCSAFLASLQGASVEYFSDAAASGQRITQENDAGTAVIASAEAARYFGLEVIKENIADQDENQTRFLVAARKPITVDMRIPCKTSIVMSTSQEPGSLVEALLVFRQSGINLTKLESRPIAGNPWEEMFYIDFEGNIDDVKVKAALDEITRKARFIKVLGCYPSQDIGATVVSPEQLAAANGAAAEEAVPLPAQQAVQKFEAPAKASVVKAKGYRLGSREYKAEDTVVEVRGVRIGGQHFTVIAGPCAVESYDQIMTCAHAVKEAGATLLRGGCFKPRSSPYSFQGLRWEGLDLLAEAGKKYGLPIVTEVLSPEDMGRAAEKSDIIQIGARNMQNFSQLAEAGRVHRPIVLKRGMSSSIEELLQAAEYILAGGNQQVILCERGIRTFETATRSTLDLSAVPVLKARTHLPVIVDPSHAAGQRDLVPPLAVAAKAIGADGVMIEIHPEPEKALSDGPQSLMFPQFQALMARLLR